MNASAVLLLAWIVRAALAVLFATALWHKARAPREFIAALGNYRVLPAALVPAAAGAVMFAEAVVLSTAAGLLGVGLTMGLTGMLRAFAGWNEGGRGCGDC